MSQPSIASASCRADISRIFKYAPAELIGRDEEMNALNEAWGRVQKLEKGRPHVLTFVALGGEGKTSLVAKWAADLAAQDWPGCDAAFAWSFYSQGTREQQAASSDLFLKEALTFFGDDADKAFAASPAGAHEKGQRLARIVGQRRCLLILDGLEPLQYAPASPTPGELKDQGIRALLRGLAAASRGLCVVTTRYSVPDLRAFWQTTAPEVPLLRLSRDAGVHLLKSLGVKGRDRRDIPLDFPSPSEAPRPSVPAGYPPSPSAAPPPPPSEAPNGASQASPGQRPGFASPHDSAALKGRDNTGAADGVAPPGLGVEMDTATQGDALGWPVSGLQPAPRHPLQPAPLASLQPELHRSLPPAPLRAPDGRELVNEYEKLVEDVKGHALTLTLLGGFLKRAFHGDIRQRDRVKFEKADEKMDGGHAFRTMAAYEQWLLRDGGDEGRREVAVLRLMGLFDRPADAGCLVALRREPIPGLTEPLDGLADEDWEFCLSGLEAAKLLTVNRDAVGALVSLDAHPHIREYFAKQVKWGSAGVAPTARPAPKGRNIPAQGNALGSESNKPNSPEGAAQGADVPPLQGLGVSGAAVPGALPQANISRPVGAETEQGTSEAWRAAHRRLYEHLCASTPDKPQPTLEDLQPLYQAVAHGCQAGLQQKACDKVYFARIARGNEGYAVNKLGAFGSELEAIACFFDQPWSRISSALTESDQAWVLGQSAFRLRALGRLAEALDPLRATKDFEVEHERWKRAAQIASNLSELELTLGAVAGAVGDAEQSVTYADRSGDAFWKMGTRTTHADALHQAGRRAEAETRFREAEQMQQGRQPDYPLLYSLPGFRYCDLHLTEAERAAWCLGRVGVSPAVPGVPPGTSGSPAPQSSGWDCQRVRRDAEPGGPEAHPTPELAAACRAVSQRAAQSLEWAKSQDWLLDIALDHLTLGRAALYAPILETGPLDPLGGASLPLDRTRECAEHLDAAVSGLRRAGHQDYLPLGLLTRAWLRFLTGARTGRESAQEDLDEAWEIAERGPMRLFLADIHLYRARLFFREAVYPWAGDDAGNPRGPKDDLKAAEALIDRCGYHRRDGELADAWEAIGR